MVKRILVIDDDEDDRELITAAFQDINQAHSVLTVCDGHTAFERLMIKEERPDVIILDLNMPGMNGFDVLRKLKNDPDLKPIPVMIYSTSRNKTDIDLSYSLGALKFATKPIMYKDLVNLLQSLLEMTGSQPLH